MFHTTPDHHHFSRQRRSMSRTENSCQKLNYFQYYDSQQTQTITTYSKQRIQQPRTEYKTIQSFGKNNSLSSRVSQHRNSGCKLQVMQQIIDKKRNSSHSRQKMRTQSQSGKHQVYTPSRTEIYQRNINRCMTNALDDEAHKIVLLKTLMMTKREDLRTELVQLNGRNKAIQVTVQAQLEKQKRRMVKQSLEVKKPNLIDSLQRSRNSQNAYERLSQFKSPAFMQNPVEEHPLLSSNLGPDQPLPLSLVLSQSKYSVNPSSINHQGLQLSNFINKHVDIPIIKTLENNISTIQTSPRPTDLLLAKNPPPSPLNTKPRQQKPSPKHIQQPPKIQILKPKPQIDELEQIRLDKPPSILEPSKRIQKPEVQKIVTPDQIPKSNIKKPPRLPTNQSNQSLDTMDTEQSLAKLNLIGQTVGTGVKMLKGIKIQWTLPCYFIYKYFYQFRVEFQANFRRFVRKGLKPQSQLEDIVQVNTQIKTSILKMAQTCQKKAVNKKYLSKYSQPIDSKVEGQFLESIEDYYETVKKNKAELPEQQLVKVKTHFAQMLNAVLVILQLLGHQTHPLDSARLQSGQHLKEIDRYIQKNMKIIRSQIGG